jgi:hypothetical protein
MHLIAKNGYLNISQAKVREWQSDYPGVDIESEVKKANSWLEKNKSRRPKTLLFMTRWLARVHESNPRNQREITTSPEDSKHAALLAEEVIREPIYAPPPFDWAEFKSTLREPESVPETPPLIGECKHEFHVCRYLKVNRCVKCETVLEGFVWPTVDGKPHVWREFFL